GNAPVREAHPVGVVKDVDTTERGRQDLWAFEVKRERFDLRAYWMVGERAKPASSSQDALGHAPAGVAEGAGDQVDRHRAGDVLPWRGGSSPIRAPDPLRHTLASTPTCRNATLAARLDSRAP